MGEASRKHQKSFSVLGQDGRRHRLSRRVSFERVPRQNEPRSRSSGRSANEGRLGLTAADSQTKYREKLVPSLLIVSSV